ncbi:uncharacterized protein [Amphiura filiformis]|uniref:uncharacterized protein n=1 Tax=Amphiura filiformis TaxID=82378 RepID=UPI003B228C38
MSSLLGVYFEPLPTLQEDDELVALSAILRRSSLRESEIWAVCRECCLALRSVSKSSLDLFKKLCLTPDTLSFNAAGSVSFSDSDVVDKDYQPPEFYRDGNTFKGHIFSLAKTLLEAAAHDLGISLEIGSTLLGLLTRMSLDDPQRRPTLEEVTVTCNRELGDDPGSSKSICRALSSFGRRKLSLESQYELHIPGGKRKSSSSSQGEASKQVTSKDNGNHKVTQNGNNTTQIGSRSSAYSSSVVENCSMQGAKSLRKSAGLNLQTSSNDLEQKPHKEQVREPPSPAALNNLSQRAQDILKKLYASNESKSNNSNEDETGVTIDSVNESSVKKDASFISRSPRKPHMKRSPSRSPNTKRKEHHGAKIDAAQSPPRSPNTKRKEQRGAKIDAARSPSRSPHTKRKEQHGAKIDAARSPSRSPNTKNKSVPDAKEISSKLKELVLSRQSSREDDIDFDEKTSARSSPDVQLRTILDRIPKSEDLRTGSPVGRRQSPSRGRLSQSPNHVSSPRALGQSPRESQRKSAQSPGTPGKHGSLRRRLSQKQLEVFFKRRKSSGRSTPEIIEGLDGDTADDLDFILGDPWSDDEKPELPFEHPILTRSYSAEGSSSAISSFPISTGGVRRTASMKQTSIIPSASSAISLENISEEKSERTTSDLDRTSEEDLSEIVTVPGARKQKRSSITAETCQLDNKPSYNNIRELTQVQNQFLNNRRSSLSDFRVPPGFGSRATHFTPIVVTDKPVLSKAASSPTMDNAKAKARAALKAKLVLNKKGHMPPPELLQDLENDALVNPLATPRSEENLLAALVQPVLRRHSSVEPPVLKRKISNDSIVSLPSELCHPLRKISTESNPDFVPSRKVSNDSTVSSVPRNSSALSDHVSSNQISSSVESVFAEVDNVTNSTGKLALLGNGDVQGLNTTVNMDSLQPKVRTVSESPITSKNSFSHIEPPQCTDTEIQLKQKSEPVLQHPKQTEATLPEVIGHMSSIDNQVKGHQLVKPIAIKSNEHTCNVDNRVPETHQPSASSSSENPTNVAISSSSIAPGSNQPMSTVSVSPSIIVNDQTVLASPVPPVAPDVHPVMSPNQYSQFFAPVSPIPVGPIISHAVPNQFTGQMSSPSQNMQAMGQISPAHLVGNQPNFYPSGMSQGMVPGSSSPVVFNPAIMPGFSYQVQLHADPQTGLYRMVPIGVPIQGVPFHGSNGSLSGNSFGSPGSNAGTPPQAPNIVNPETNAQHSNTLHSYWTRQKNTLDTSSDGDSTCIPMSPEAVRRAVVDRKKDQVKKRMEKSRHGTPPTKKSNAKTASSSLIRNATDSESSESYALAKPKENRTKPSPQITKKKHMKVSLSDGDHKERIKERVREQNEQKTKREGAAFPRSVSCDHLKGSTRHHQFSSNEASAKSQEDLTNTEIKQTTKSKYATEDCDDSRPLDMLPLAAASPASVSSVSHDSGVNMRFNGMSSGEDMFAASQLADALQGYNVVRRVMKLIRHAFAFDGYLENGIEDREMAEYITSLAKLSWMTFANAVTEKFCDLYWEEELLEKLYEAINGEKAVKPQQSQHRPNASHPKRTKPHTKPSKSHAAKMKPQKPKASPPVNSKHPEEDDILSDLLPDDTFLSSSSAAARHSRSAVKASLRSDSKHYSSDKKSSADIKANQRRARSHSSDKSRSASRDRTKSKAAVTPKKEDKNNEEKTDGQRSDGKKLAPLKPKRNPSPACIEPVAKAQSKKHDSKEYDLKTSSKHDPKPAPRRRAQSRDATKLETDVGVRKSSKQAKSVKEKEMTIKDSNCDEEDLLSGLPAENQLVVKSNQIISSKSRESLPNSLNNSQSKEALSSSLSDSQFNSMNKDLLDLNQSRTSNTSSQLSDNNTNLNESISSYEGPVMTSVPSGTNLNESISSYEGPVMTSVPSGSKLNGNRTDNESIISEEAPPLPPRNTPSVKLRSSSHENVAVSDCSVSNSPAARISSLLHNALSRTDSMLSTSSTSSSSTSHFLKTSGDDSTLSGSFNTDDNRPGLPNGMVYRSDGGIDPRIAAYTQQLTGAGETQNSIESKIADVEQQLMMERKMRSKTDKFYQKLIDAQQTKGADHKTMLAKVGKQRTEMTTKIEFLESAKRHLEMLYAEQWGLDLNLLYSFATSMGTEPLHLKESEDNQLLSFHKGRNKHSVQAGEPLGLFSFLFARQALLDGYLHHFFYTYHYFATSGELLQFIMEKFEAAISMYESNQQENRSKILCRALDILQVWVEGFYEVDFRKNPKVLEQLIIFTTEKIIPVDPQGQSLLHLLDKYQREKASISGGGWPNISRKLSSASQQSSPVRDPIISPSRPRHQDASPRSLKMGIMACFTKKDSSKQSSESSYLPVSSMDKEGFSLSQHTSLTLAQQLTLMQQDLFQRVHPVHYLNSRCKGIGVSTNNNSTTTTPSSITVVHNGMVGDVGDLCNSLFVDCLADDGIIRMLLDHARSISHWVSAEVVTCNSSKTQMALLSKFINTARACYDMRNFATCVQIMDGLDNLIVRQVPAWRSLPSKVVSIYENLSGVRMSLQGDSESLVTGDSHQPTLPPTLLFLMHVQQLEIGGFQLANGMYKWTKIKSIAKLIDLIRLFQDKVYDLEPDVTFQELLKQRADEFHHDDIQVLAAHNNLNFHQLSSNKGGRRLHNALQRVKANLQH